MYCLTLRRSATMATLHQYRIEQSRRYKTMKGDVDKGQATRLEDEGGRRVSHSPFRINSTALFSFCSSKR